ncbi:MAG: DUF5610 domain-containing protein [bacterium]
MANPISNLPGLSPVKKAQEPHKTTSSGERKSAYLRAGAGPARAHGEGLALSILEDGGLALLRRELEESLRDVFPSGEEGAAGPEGKKPEDSFSIGLDTSPEAVAERVLGFALGFFPNYKARNAGQDETETLNRFEAEIRRGIEDGFRRAKDALAGLGMLQGETSDRIEETYGLVQDKLAAAFAPEEE